MDSIGIDTESIFDQKKNTHDVISQKVLYVIEIIKQYISKSDIRLNELKILGYYLDKTIAQEDLTDYEQFLIMRKITLINIRGRDTFLSDQQFNPIIESIVTSIIEIK